MSTSIRASTRVVAIPTDGDPLTADLVVPAGATAIVLFVHGSGSTRKSPRNVRVAEELNSAGFATLLFDLLTAQEAAFDASTGRLRFDIALLARRLGFATDWVVADDTTHMLRIGFFGASTGAAAALVTAADRPDIVAAVVSRGGRPDLAGDRLQDVRAPTLLIVGGDDHEVLRLNERAAARMRTTRELRIVPGATHLFEEPGAMEQVSQHALDWFRVHLE
jgi:putative phosphoribosyl transferase